MATPERVPTSRRLRSAAVAERERLTRELERLDRRAAALAEELAQLDVHRQEIREQVALLARLAHASDDSAFPRRLRPVPEGRSDSAADAPARDVAPLGTLRGARIREVAVLLLAASPQPTNPIHYAEWFKRVRSAGYAIAGRDPLAAFLTQISRSPVVARAGAPGVYALDLDAPDDLRQRVASLRAKLAQLDGGDASTAEQVATVRKRRVELSRGLAEAERHLEEALRSLGEGQPGEDSASG